jgi:hypothetical protein
MTDADFVPTYYALNQQAMISAMTQIRIRVAAIALGIAFQFVLGACSTHRSAKDQSESRTVSSRRMADGKEWTTGNLNIDASLLIVTTMPNRIASIWAFVYVGVGPASVPVARTRVALADR